MENKKKYLFIILTIFILIILFFLGSFEWKNINYKNSKLDIDIDTNLSLPKSQVEYIESLVGLEAKNMKILDKPLRIEGSFYIPEDTILSYINYYLKKSNNKNIENVQVTINKNGLTIGGQYKLLAYLKAPIDIEILPSINEDNNLRLNLKDIRLLNLSLNDDIIDAIVDSWFSDIDNVSVDKGDIIIDKSFFGSTSIKSISVEDDCLQMDISIVIK